MSLLTDHHFPRHAHDGFGIGVMASGAQRSWSGVGFVEAGPGSVITVNPGEMHDGAPVGGTPRGWRMLYLAPALMADQLQDEGETQPEIAAPALRDDLLAGLIRHLHACVVAPRPDEPLAIEEALLRTVAHLLRHHGARGARQAPAQTSPAVAAARRRLDEAPALPTSLAELAQLAGGCSRFQLLRAFAREVGATPHAYLVQRRVRLAQRLLRAGAPPAEAALHAGFADQSHLTRAFHRQFGITPGRYRAMMLA
jgi:AraC-like DNA-binding protein